MEENKIENEESQKFTVFSLSPFGCPGKEESFSVTFCVLGRLCSEKKDVEKDWNTWGKVSKLEEKSKRPPKKF